MVRKTLVLYQLEKGIAVDSKPAKAVESLRKSHQQFTDVNWVSLLIR